MTSLGEIITRKSSIQTYITFKLLADKNLVKDSMNGYAYFRWFDDEIDLSRKTRKYLIRLINRQKKIINAAYSSRKLTNLLPEEKLIIDLIASNRDKKSKLGSFITNFINIIEFDAIRKGTTVTRKELKRYSETLAVAVIDCIQYFINHTFHYPCVPQQYHAAIGAHITHMLRDYHEDLGEGFINIPREYLCKYGITPRDTNSKAFRNWVKHQVSLARQYLRSGMAYWADLPVFRGKLAAFWYCCRFVGVLNTIENDGYILRRRYHRKKSPVSYLKILWMGLRVMAAHSTHGQISLSI